jgi:putative oxidoreductase
VASASFDRSWRRWTLLPLRLVVGYGFLAHGLAKWQRGPETFGRVLQVIGVPFPALTAWMVTLLEIFGGLALLVGAFVMLACIPMICTMVVAMFTVHLRYGFSAANTVGQDASGPILGPPGYELSLLYIGALLALALARPSALSVDAWRVRAAPGGASPLEAGRAPAPGEAR